MKVYIKETTNYLSIQQNGCRTFVPYTDGFLGFVNRVKLTVYGWFHD